EPEHGSDQLYNNKQLFNPQDAYGRPNCVAKLYDDKVVINGRKSDGISNGPPAKSDPLLCCRYGRRTRPRTGLRRHPAFRYQRVSVAVSRWTPWGSERYLELP